jgi:hypothetical protein
MVDQELLLSFVQLLERRIESEGARGEYETQMPLASAMLEAMTADGVAPLAVDERAAVDGQRRGTRRPVDGGRAHQKLTTTEAPSSVLLL